MFFQRVLAAVMFCLLAACGGGGSGQGTWDKSTGSNVTASFPADSSVFLPGEAVFIRLEPHTEGSISAEINGNHVDSVLNDGEVNIVMTNLPSGRHSLILTVNGQTVTLAFDIADLTLSSASPEVIDGVIAEALDLLVQHLDATPNDAVAEALRTQLAALHASLQNSMADYEVAQLAAQLTANPLVPAELPQSCSAAQASYQSRVKSMKRTIALTDLFLAKHEAKKVDATHMAVLVAKVRMDASLARFHAFVAAGANLCNGDFGASREADKVRGRHSRVVAAVATLTR